jgi:hypothetical protein
MSHHEPSLQLNYLYQCLSQNKRPIGFFLSAGCPVSIKIEVKEKSSPLIPDIAGLTEIVCTQLAASPLKEKFKIIQSHLKEDGNTKPNIEEILTHIRSLQQVAGNKEIRGIKSVDLAALDTKICAAIVDIVRKDLPESNTPYHQLSAWINAVQRDRPVEIFTTNYDLLTEQALESYRVPYFDGFSGSYNSFFDSYSMEEDILPPQWARLWKLHGSINWFRNPKNGGITRRIAHQTETDLCRVIHPSHLKYDESRKMPYLAMIDRLKNFIKQPHAVLITCGYSFRDEHINAILSEGLHSNSTAIIFALLHSELGKYPLATNIAKFSPNFNLLAKDGAIIGTKQSVWAEKVESDFEKSGLIIKSKTNSITDPLFCQVVFSLGDFNKFGHQLEEIMGINKYKDSERHEK